MTTSGTFLMRSSSRFSFDQMENSVFSGEREWRSGDGELLLLLRHQRLRPEERHRHGCGASSYFIIISSQIIIIVRELLKSPIQVHHIEHIRSVAGVEHIGIGGDFNGVEEFPEGLQDVSQYPNVRTHLINTMITIAIIII